jgi:probable O-glycosylation ligase (exosortase A-associated)
VISGTAASHVMETGGLSSPRKTATGAGAGAIAVILCFIAFSDPSALVEVFRPVFRLSSGLLVLASLPICFHWPWIGALVWGWVRFMYPLRLATAQVFGISLSWFVLAVIVAGLVVNERRHALPRTREMALLLVLWGWCGLTTITASIYPERAWPWFEELSWIMTAMLIIIALAHDRARLNVLAWILALVLGLYAAAGVLWLIHTGGAEYLYGIPASDLQNNNDLAAALVAVAPFFVFLGRDSPRWWVRCGQLVLFGATVFAILGTFSRASVLALLAILLLLAVHREWRALVVAAAAWTLFLFTTNWHEWVRRILTIANPDASASMRFNHWYVAVRIGLDHPILGAGFRPFSKETYARYIPGLVDDHDAHNIFLQVFAEHGFPGLALYLGLIACTLATLWHISQRGDEAQNYARMLQIGLIGFVVAGMFHCLSYRIFFFQLLTLSILLDVATRPGRDRTVR